MRLLTTREAAALAGISPAGVRQLARRARAKGVELRAPREAWPDQRTPLYDRDALQRYLAGRKAAEDG